ncbi:MAG: N-acetylmuramoyl-L-alanine amidase [Lachnospiraceae bacterium]|nr:N-acetylmuramoyl-L-alanine amidase [Lachnospiraceae bacterium]
MKKSPKKNVNTILRIILAILFFTILAVAVVYILKYRENKPETEGINAEGTNAKEIETKETETQETETDRVLTENGQTEMSETTETGDVVVQETKAEEMTEQLNIPAWITASGVNLRLEPSTDCEVLHRLGRNTELILQYEKDGWGAVEYDGIRGYVSMDYLTMEEPATNGFVVVIDPGHQKKGDSTKEPNGPDSSVMKARVTGGTSGCSTGVMEYELNLAVSLQLRDELEARGYIVYMTRETHDVNISNMERAQYATSVSADIAVRIHANGSENSSVSGALALAPSSGNPYVSSLSSASQNLSKCILDAYCAATGMKNQGVVSSDTMTGINWSTVPVTILEMGYMTNQTDDINMEDASYQQKMVEGIADGIDDYFGL